MDDPLSAVVIFDDAIWRGPGADGLMACNPNMVNGGAKIHSAGSIAELAALAGLPADAGAKFPAQLSGGMVKRAALARALALDPDILFLDEPTAGLDPIGAAAFDQLILMLRDSLGLTVFLVTHDLDTLYTICDRVAVLSQKRVLVADTLDVVERFDDRWVRDYFQGPRGRSAFAASERATRDAPMHAGARSPPAPASSR
jgi:phospholipid/cholesterol/gamma-HCH transport system ATP-binding protein